VSPFALDDEALQVTGHRAQLPGHAQVVDRTRDVVGDQGAAVRLPQHVGDIVRAQARVHGNVDGADLGAREHGVDPFGAVLEPDGDLVARSHPELDQALGDTIDIGCHLAE
jgi:hypothetical protein